MAVATRQAVRTAGQVDAIYQALKGADDAYTQAEMAIARAVKSG